MLKLMVDVSFKLVKLRNPCMITSTRGPIGRSYTIIYLYFFSGLKELNNSLLFTHYILSSKFSGGANWFSNTVYANMHNSNCWRDRKRKGGNISLLQ